MFRIYDREDKGQIPLLNLRDILTKELFVRSHWEDVDEANQNPSQSSQIKSSYGDRVMRDVMTEIMDQYDTDGNKAVDLQEFMFIVSDHDVDMLLSLY